MNSNVLDAGSSAELSIRGVLDCIAALLGSNAEVMSYSTSDAARRSHTAADDTAMGEDVPVPSSESAMPNAHQPSPLASIELHVTRKVVFPASREYHAKLMAPSLEVHCFADAGTAVGACDTMGACVAVGACVGALVGKLVTTGWTHVPTGPVSAIVAFLSAP